MQNGASLFLVEEVILSGHPQVIINEQWVIMFMVFKFVKVEIHLNCRV